MLHKYIQGWQNMHLTNLFHYRIFLPHNTMQLSQNNGTVLFVLNKLLTHFTLSKLHVPTSLQKKKNLSTLHGQIQVLLKKLLFFFKETFPNNSSVH
jgi:hypothetical protein